MPSVYFETFGCQMNVADSNMLADALFARGYLLAGSAGEADLIVVNTCSVRERAEVRARARITQYVNQCRKAGGAQRIWVIGCMAQRLGEALKKEIPGIERVIGAPEIVSFAHDIDNLVGDKHGAREDGGGVKISAFVPVMRGCDNFCSYCIVPYVRGREASIPAGEIARRVQELVDAGTREVTLLGQNVNSYRDGPTDFAGLLRKVHDIRGLLRIRFTTSHPKDCSGALVRTMAELPKVCRHVHLPVQSGSDRILGLMNRGYTRKDYLSRIDAIRFAMPDADITTDAMVGFPGETDEEFLETLSLFRAVRFTTAFMFAYSRREGTVAATMADDVPVQVKKERLAALIGLQTAITRERYDEMLGRKVEALFIERQGAGERLWMGQDGGAKRILLSCDENIAGTILQVQARRSSGMTLVCERCKE